MAVASFSWSVRSIQTHSASGGGCRLWPLVVEADDLVVASKQRDEAPADATGASRDEHDTQAGTSAA